MKLHFYEITSKMLIYGKLQLKKKKRFILNEIVLDRTKWIKNVVSN